MLEVWPVIHIGPAWAAIANARMAQVNGCAGVMLISMKDADDDIDRLAEMIRDRVPGLKIGANYLSMMAPEALMRSQMQGHDATWTDRQEFTRGEYSREARDIMAIRRDGHLFFAAVAFKGQPPDPFPGASARLAAFSSLIPTTSGERTGVAPPVEKLRRIRQELEPADPLALASGATPENIGDMAPFLTHVLVSTGISGKPYEFDQSKLAALIRNANQPTGA